MFGLPRTYPGWLQWLGAPMSPEDARYFGTAVTIYGLIAGFIALAAAVELVQTLRREWRERQEIKAQEAKR